MSSTVEGTTITSVSENGYRTLWHFTPTHATFTVAAIPTGSRYYVLYEGTPGGGDGLALEDFYLRSDGRRFPIATCFNDNNCAAPNEVLGDPAWVGFSGKGLKRMLLFIQQDNDDIRDCYYPMGPINTSSSMTVFGFGRVASGASPGMTKTPNVFHVALVEDTAYALVSAVAQEILSTGSQVIRTPRLSFGRDQLPTGMDRYDIRGRRMGQPAAGVMLERRTDGRFAASVRIRKD